MKYPPEHLAAAIVVVLIGGAVAITAIISPEEGAPAPVVKVAAVVEAAEVAAPPQVQKLDDHDLNKRAEFAAEDNLRRYDWQQMRMLRCRSSITAPNAGVATCEYTVKMDRFTIRGYDIPWTFEGEEVKLGKAEVRAPRLEASPRGQ